MKRNLIILLVIALLAMMAAVPAFADGHRGRQRFAIMGRPSSSLNLARLVGIWPRVTSWSPAR